MSKGNQELTFEVNIHSSVAVFQQIENLVTFYVASGRLKPDDQLPAIKEMGDRVGVNFNTVAKAYRDLEIMGIIYTRRGMGCFINKGAEKLCSELVRSRIVEKLHETTQEAKAAGIPKSALVQAVNTSQGIEGSPYGETPKKVLAGLKG